MRNSNIIYSDKRIKVVDLYGDKKVLSIENKKNKNSYNIILDSSLECTWELQEFLKENSNGTVGKRWIYRYCREYSPVIRKYYNKSGNLNTKLRDKDWYDSI